MGDGDPPRVRSSTRCQTRDAERDPGEVGDDVDRVPRAAGQEGALDDLADDRLGHEEGDDGRGPQAREQGDRDRDEEDEDVDDLVGLREEQPAVAARGVQDDDLHGDGEPEEGEQGQPTGAPVGGVRVGGHAGSRAATAARTASATTWLTSGWNTLGMM